MNLTSAEILSFSKGLRCGDFTVQHLLEAFDYDEELVQKIITKSETLEAPEPDDTEAFTL